MAYNLPPPWDPGFALPDNVRDEGLERQAYVTKQMPRGTYDQPKVGTGGYVVPQYVMDEGYGQGTFTTKWEPRGQYDGGRIPNWLNERPGVRIDSRSPRGKVTATVSYPVIVQPVNQGAVAMSGADEVLRRVARVPQHQRLGALKQSLDRADKSLWPKMQNTVRALVSRGMTPGQAVRESLRRVLSATPKLGSLLGLGGYRASALGADEMTAAFFHAPAYAPAPAPVPFDPNLTATLMLPQPQEGDCDATSTYVFTAGAWQRRVSETRGGAPCVRVTNFTVQAPSTPAVVVTDDKGVVQAPIGTAMDLAEAQRRIVSDAARPKLQIGPFLFQDNGGLIRAHYSQLPVSWQQWFAAQVTQDYNPAWYKIWKTRSLKRDGAFVGRPGEQVGFIEDQVIGIIPIATVVHPLNGETWGIYIWNVDRYGNGTFNISFEKVTDLPLLKRTFSWIAKLIAKVMTIPCEHAADPEHTKKAESVAGPWATAGAFVTNFVCGAAGYTPTTPPVPPPDQITVPAGSSDILPLALLGGAGLVALLLLTKKKKAPSP